MNVPQQKPCTVQKLVKRVVTKKRSRATMPGPIPLATSSFPEPKKEFLRNLILNPPTEIETELLPTEIKSGKTRKYFPEINREYENRRTMFEDFDFNSYGASKPTHSYYSCSRRETTPIRTQWSTSAPSNCGTSTEHDKYQQDIASYLRYLDQIEAKELNMIQEDVKQFQQARRKLIMDKHFYAIKESSRQRF